MVVWSGFPCNVFPYQVRGRRRRRRRRNRRRMRRRSNFLMESLATVL
jgi:hypothetical protein